MCNTKQSYETSSRPSHSTRRTDRIKLPSSHNSPPSYGYYPPYPRYIPYEPYGIHHHPIPSCPPSCYNNHENHNEFVSESKGKSWLLIILLIVILLALGIALYRIISKTNQRFRTIRQTNNPVSSIQTVRRKKDAIQNCPAEFVRCVGMISKLRKECSMPCEQCRKLPFIMSSTKIFETMQNTSSEIDEDENTLNTGIINIPRSKISIATDMSSLSAINTKRS